MPILSRGDYDAARLHLVARESRDAGQTRRLLALAAIYDGAARTEAASIGGVTVQIVRDWVVKLNTGSIRKCGVLGRRDHQQLGR